VIPWVKKKSPHGHSPRLPSLLPGSPRETCPGGPKSELPGPCRQRSKERFCSCPVKADLILLALLISAWKRARGCAAAFARRLTLNLPHSVSVALLLGPWLVSAAPFLWGRGQDPGAPSHAAFCSFVTRDVPAVQRRQARPRVSFPLSQELSSCLGALLRSTLPWSWGSGVGSGVASGSADALGMKLRVRRAPRLTSFLEDQPHSTPLQPGEGGYAWRGPFCAMPAPRGLGPTQDCWVALFFRLYFSEPG